MIAVIDYGVGNLKSVEKALEYIGEDVCVTADHAKIKSANKVILPGVGSFDDAMANLITNGLDEVVREIIKDGKPFLGICLGMQMLFDTSVETINPVPSKGLSILSGSILKIPKKVGLKVPQMGWNNLKIEKESKILQGIKDNTYVYFVHSYYLKAKNLSDVAATVNYSEILDVAVERDNVFALQFHPEKSGVNGLKILKNFAAIR